jgi:hypothetical protein
MLSLHLHLITAVSAPKRPASAFLSFSNSKRSEVKEANKDLNTTEISRILAIMWKEAPDSERRKFIDNEFTQRQKYKEEMKEWKKSNDQYLQQMRRADSHAYYTAVR